MRKLIILGRTATVLFVVVLLLTVVIKHPDAYTSTKDHIVEIRNLEYYPKELIVSPGDTITWINYDFVPHTVTADDESWDSGLLKANDKWQIEIADNMHSTYYCRYHPNMKASFSISK